MNKYVIYAQFHLGKYIFITVYYEDAMICFFTWNSMIYNKQMDDFLMN